MLMSQPVSSGLCCFRENVFVYVHPFKFIGLQRSKFLTVSEGGFARLGAKYSSMCVSNLSATTSQGTPLKNCADRAHK